MISKKHRWVNYMDNIFFLKQHFEFMSIHWFISLYIINIAQKFSKMNPEEEKINDMLGNGNQVVKSLKYLMYLFL